MNWAQTFIPSEAALKTFLVLLFLLTLNSHHSLLMFSFASIIPEPPSPPPPPHNILTSAYHFVLKSFARYVCVVVVPTILEVFLSFFLSSHMLLKRESRGRVGG